MSVSKVSQMPSPKRADPTMMPFARKAIPRAYRITRSMRVNRLFPVFTLNIFIEIAKVV